MNLILIKSAKEKIIQKKIDRIKKLKDLCKSKKQYRDLVKEYNHDIDIIDGIVIKFCDDIDNTAKTVNGDICINSKLLNASPTRQLRYIIHELVHVFQHIKNEGLAKSKSDEYLKNPDEIEAFQYQLEYQEDNENNVEKYMKDFLNFHKVPKKEREEVVDLFTDKMSDKEVKSRILKDD